MRKFSVLMALLVVLSLVAVVPAMTVSADTTPIDASLDAVPGSFTTDTVTAGGELVYNFYRIGGTILTINDANATITNGEDVITAVDGVLTYNVPPIMPMMPTTLVVGNTGTEDKAFTLEFAYPLGSMSNPEALEELGYIDATVAVGNTDGYYYTWTAPEAGTVTATISSVTEGALADLAITNQNSYAMRSISADGVENDFGETEIVIEVSAGDVLSIQAVVLPDEEDWSLPTTDTDISFYANFAAVPGTENNPIVPDYFDIPGSFETVEIAAGTTVYYQLYNVGGTILSIEADVTVNANGTDHNAKDGVVEFVVPESLMPRAPITLAITNNGDEAAKYTVKFDIPVGAMTNPEIIEELVDINVSLDEGDYDGYYYSWTAPEDGVLSVKLESTSEGTMAEVVLVNGLVVKNASDADENGVISIDVAEGDEVIIQVVGIGDESTNYVVLATNVEVSVDFAAANADSSETETDDSSDAETDDSSDAETDDSSDAEAGDSSDAETGDTPATGDAGMAVFAILAVVSLAGVVVAKKVK